MTQNQEPSKLHTSETEPRLGKSSRHRQADLPKLAFVFSGIGAQWWAMGRHLWSSETVFREVINRCDNLLRFHTTSWSLCEELTASKERSRINETQIAQPAIFAVQVALAALWRSWGIYPDTVVGHSVGEVAAAYVAGVLSLEDAISVIFHRSRIQARGAGQGKMLAIALSKEEVEHIIVGYSEQVCIAAINSPKAITLSGDNIALTEIAQFLAHRQIFSRFLRVDVPYHSPKMEPLKIELVESLQAISPQPATTPIFSTVTGQQVSGPELDAAYWVQNMRNPVQFAAAVNGLIHAGHDIFLEISAHPVLSSSISECLAQANKVGTVLPSLRRQDSELTTMIASLSQLKILGVGV
ncbi:MAG: acyltransferase domain-containing protein [Stigonema ocellatum SAG 48.90 = DSM 106950]|nr:acyltransferase domain-containing protein [Stigonema ocellatum SAG 48.90 = DSM 106950]